MMIYTCTLNPSVDYIVKIENVNIGSLNRADNTAFYPGGKGINVSRVLKRLGQETTALGFIGGFTGHFIENSLIEEGVHLDFIEVIEPTRVNVKLKSSVETEINGQGPAVSKENEQELFAKVSSMTDQDYLVLAGSLPPTLSPDYYQLLAKQCKENKTRLIVDTSGDALKDLLTYKPFLVKPNQHELGEFFNVEISSIEEAVEYGRKLLDFGPENVIVSLGGDGALLLNGETTVFANVPKGELKNSVGAGDSLVAGFIAAYVEKGDFLEAFKYGIASGSATAFSNDLCEKSTVESLLKEINIEQL